MRYLITAIIIFSVAAYGQLVVNEIMFNPSGSPENEWFEIYNISDSDVDLSGWMWSDSSYSGSPTAITDSAYIIPSGGYAIVSKSTWDTPPSCGVIVPSTWRALNNSGYDGVYIFDQDTNLVDKVIYVESEHGCDEDVSLERIDPYGSSTDQSNWDCCTDVSGATPCAANSVAPADYDLAISNITTEPQNPLPDETFTVKVWAKNVGLNDMPATDVSLYLDVDESETYSSGDSLLGSGTTIPLATGESTSVDFALTFPAGLVKLVAVLNDSVGNNNEYYRVVVVADSTAEGRIIITEIMFKPDSSSEEWVELYNDGDGIVDIANWTIADPSGEYTITTTSTPIAPGDFLIIGEFDTTFSCGYIYCSDWPWLNNDGDSLWLRDSEDSLIDQAAYTVSGSWDYGVSAELTSLSADGADVSNWGASRSSAGSTPCDDNSLWNMTPSEKTSVVISPNPFDPQLENSEIVVNAPYDATVEIHLYDLRGKLIRDFGSVFSTTWDGKDEDGRDVPTGPYVLVVQIETNGNKEYEKVPIAVARGMR